MAAQIISFAARVREPASRDWSSQELAEFYRVESALLQAGLQLEGDRGLSDEGDPWFVFCRVDTGEVFIHFARVDGWYVVDGAAMGAPARGRDFAALVRDLITRHPLTDVRRPGSNVHLHPAAILIALVGAAFFHSGRARAAEPDGPHVDDAAGASPRAEPRRGLLLNVGGSAPGVADGGRAVALDASEVAAVLTGVAIGLREIAAAGPSAAAPTADLGGPAPAFPPPTLREGVVRLERAATVDVLGGLAATDARAALTVMAVFHDLARSAVTSVAAPAGSAVAATSAPTLVDPSPTAAPPSPPPGGPAPQLMVHLASGPLPQIEALALVSADGVLARMSPDRVVHVDQLPGLLSYLINHGEAVSPPPPPPPPSSDPTVSDPSAPAGGSDHTSGTGVLADPAHHGQDKPAPADPAHDTPPVIVATPPEAAPATPPVNTGGNDTGPGLAPAPPSHPAGPSDYDLRVDAAVQAFVSQVAGAQVMITEHDVVIYDPQILAAMNQDHVLDSITWKLEDGSTISLVGTVQELHAFHGVG